MVDLQLDAFDARLRLRGLNSIITPLFADNTLLRVSGGDEAVQTLPHSFDVKSEVVITTFPIVMVMSRSASPAASVPDEASRALMSLVATASRGATIGYASNANSFCAAGERHKDAKGRAVTTWGTLMSCFRALPLHLEQASVASAAEAEESIQIVLHSIGTRSSVLHRPPFLGPGARPDGAHILECFEQGGAVIENLDVAIEYEGEDALTARLFAHRGWRQRHFARNTTVNRYPVVGTHGGFEILVQDAFFDDLSDADRAAFDAAEPAELLEAISGGGENGVTVGTCVWQAVRARRVKVYSTLYDDTKGFVGSRRPSSFDNAENLLVSALQAKATVEDLIKRRLRCTHASRYGWREEYTLLKFTGGSEKLLSTAVALTCTLSRAMRVTSVDIDVEECVAGHAPAPAPLQTPSPLPCSAPQPCTCARSAAQVARCLPRSGERRLPLHERDRNKAAMDGRRQARAHAAHPRRLHHPRRQDRARPAGVLHRERGHPGDAAPAPPLD